MNLLDYEGRNVRITCHSGNVYEGIAEDYTNPWDNEENIASICIGENTELYENEIKRIEIID